MPLYIVWSNRQTEIFVVIAIAAIVSALGSRGVSIALEAHLLTRIVVLLYIFSLPSSSSAFAFRRRLHRFRIFCFRSDRPIHVYFSINCRQRSFLSHRHWPGWDTAPSLTHTHAYGALSNHLLVVVNPLFVSIGFILSRSVGLVSIEFEPPPTIFFFFLVPAALAIRIWIYIASLCLVLGRQFTYERIRDT